MISHHLKHLKRKRKNTPNITQGKIPVVIKLIITVNMISVILFGCITKTIYLNPEGELSYRTKYENIFRDYNGCEDDLDRAIRTIDELDSCP